MRCCTPTIRPAVNLDTALQLASLQARVQALETSALNANMLTGMRWGTSPNPTLNSAGIVNLAFYDAAETRVKSFTMNGDGGYLYFVYPVSYGVAEVRVNGFINTAWTITTVSHTNAGGLTVNYYVYRSNTVQHGTGIEISLT